jgi:hypothetical protein
MLKEAFLRRLVVIRRYREQSIAADSFDFSREVNDFLRVVPAGSRQNRGFPRTLLDRNFNDPQMLGASQRRTFTGRTAGYEEIHAGGDLAPHQLSQCSLVQGKVRPKRRYERRAASDELHRGLLFCSQLDR